MPANNPDPYTTDMLAAVIEALEGAAARLRAIQELMKLLEIKELPIRNSKNLQSKGLPKVNAFAQAAEEALTKHRLAGN